jgi:arsenate reductase
MLKVYTLAQCSTCRDATKWLRAQRIEFAEVPIREQPPPVGELKRVAHALGDSRRLFNTSGIEYRAQKLSEKLPQLNDAARFQLLAGNGSLVKRPFVVGDGIALVGFNEARWAEAFADRGAK